MNVYLWANEIDPQILSGIYKGSDTVWTPAPSTKRLLLCAETDWVPSSDWEWEDYNTGNYISYVDMPVDYKAIRLDWTTDDSYSFVPQDSGWNSDYSLKFSTRIMWWQWVTFSGIKYVTYGWTAFGVDLTEPRTQVIPMDETWGAPQDWDKMVMVFNTQTGPSTFTHSQCFSLWTTIANNLTTLMWGYATRYNYRILGDDWYWYILWHPGWASNPLLYWIKLDKNWDIVTYTTDPVPSQFTQSWMPDYFNGTDESTNMFVTISNALWIQISNTQEFWMCIYNHLQ